jgi:hypothetical protein
VIAAAGGRRVRLFVLVCLRPRLGALLGLLLPPPRMRNAFVRWTFFRWTGAWYERAWKSEASPPLLPRWAYIFDLLYYAFGALVLPGLALAGFIMMIGLRAPSRRRRAGAW